MSASTTSTFEVKLHLAPLFSRKDPDTGIPTKRSFGPWMLKSGKLLAKGKLLRETYFDPFGYTHEHRMERNLIRDYKRLINDVLQYPSESTYQTIVAVAELPDMIRGFGHVKHGNYERYLKRPSELHQELSRQKEIVAEASRASCRLLRRA